MFATPSENNPNIRGTASEFILERKYLKNVTPKTLAWYGDSFKAFADCESPGDYVKRIGEMRDRGVAAVSVNTYLRTALKLVWYQFVALSLLMNVYQFHQHYVVRCSFNGRIHGHFVSQNECNNLYTDWFKGEELARQEQLQIMDSENQ